MKGPVKIFFWSIKNSCEVINKLKSRGFCAASLSTYDFFTLYTTLPHNILLQNFSVVSSVSPHVCFFLVLILISMFLK